MSSIGSVFDSLVGKRANNPLCDACVASGCNMVKIEEEPEPYCWACSFSSSVAREFTKEDLENMISDVAEAVSLYNSIAERVDALLAKWEDKLFCSPLYTTYFGNRIQELRKFARYCGDTVDFLRDLAAGKPNLRWLRSSG